MRCTRGELEEFFDKSKIWADICDELDMWIADNHLYLEDSDGKMSLTEFKEGAAICRAIRRVKDVWKYMQLELENEEEKRNG
jgi:hypothetical protein